MALFDLTQISLERALVGSAMRQRVLADNLANANTPGFKRSDVDFHSTLSRALEASAGSTGRVAEAGFSPVADANTVSRADGNNVDVDAEMANLTENSLEYQALIAVAKGRLRILETAIGAVR